MDFNKIKGIVFDLDGTLIDTEYYQWQGWVEALKPLGIFLNKDDYFEYAGKRADQIEPELVKKYNLKTKPGQLTTIKHKFLDEWFNTKEIKLMPYAKEAVDYFSKKFKVAVASGSIKKYEIILKLKRAGLLSYFPVIAGGSEIKRGKPFPDIYRYAVEKLELEPAECLALEDTQFGVEAAKSAGLTCFAIPGEFSLKQNFSKADKIFKTLKEAVDFFQAQFEIVDK